MVTSTFVTIAPLDKVVNQDLYDYFEDVVPFYSYLLRRSFHHYKSGLGITTIEYRNQLKADFGLTNRFAKVIVMEAKNRLNLLTAGLMWQFNNLPHQIKAYEKSIAKVKSKLNGTTNRHRRKILKQVLFSKQVKLNRLNQRLSLGFSLKTTFGSSKLLNSDVTAFKLKRDNQLVYIGNYTEKAGNQQFQLQFDSRRNKFLYRCRLENQFVKDNSKYIYGEFILKDKTAKRCILDTIRNPKSNPLTFRIVRNGDALNLQIMYRYTTSERTRDSNGVLGIDFNKGFINVSEIDRCGNLMNTVKIDYLHKGQAKKTHQSMIELVSEVSRLALSTGKDVVIENLKSLNRRKADKKKSKKYNHMLNTLKFGKFKKLLLAKGKKLGYAVHTVNPYNTSNIGDDKYAHRMKLNRHTAASYVIARRHYAYD